MLFFLRFGREAVVFSVWGILPLRCFFVISRCSKLIYSQNGFILMRIWTALPTMLLLCRLKHIAKYKWGLANLVLSLRLNTFTKIELDKWLNEPFTPPSEPTGEE